MMKHFNKLKTKSILFLIGLSLLSLEVRAQSTNTKYRLKHNASGLYLGNNGNGSNAAALMNLDVNDPSQVWFLLESGTSDQFYLMNESGHYLGRDNSNWWETEIFSYNWGDASFYTYTLTATSGGYYIDNISVGDGESIGTDGTSVGNYVFVNKSGANAEWVFESVTNFVIWDGSWSNGTGPTSSDDVLVNSALAISSDITMNNLVVTLNGSVSVSSGTTTVNGFWNSVGSISVESGASLLTSSGPMTWGNVTVKRNSSFTDEQLRYSFIGSPVSGFEIGNLGAGYHYTYNTSDDSYGTFSGEMIAGVGYTSAGKLSLEFVGSPNVGTILVTIDNSGNKFNLVSNPYASAIDRTSFVAANAELTGAIYLWDDGGSNSGQRTNSDFVTVTNAGAVSGGSGGSGASFDQNTAIRSAQGFIVQATSAGDITFSESMRVSGNNSDDSFFRKTEDMSKFKVALSDGNNFDELLVAFNKFGTGSFDRMWDAAKYPYESGLSIYSKGLHDNSDLAVQTLPDLGNMPDEIEVPLGVQVDQSGEYTFSLKESNLGSEWMITLVDHTTLETYDLSQTVSLSLSSQSKDRFSLRLVNVGGVLSTLQKRVNMFYSQSDNRIHFSGNTISGHAQLVIYDLSGKVYQTDIFEMDKNSGTVELKDLRPGVYVARLRDGNNQSTLKFILH